MDMKTLILGLGNPILSDDGVGVAIARRLKESVKDPEVVVQEGDTLGFGILDQVTGYEKVILIDAIRTKGGKPGEVHRLDLKDLQKTAHFNSVHGANLASAWEIGRRLGLELPSSVSIYAVEGKDMETFSERCTPEVAEAIPSIVQMIREKESL